MADIALLVTEEFEKKVKRGAPNPDGSGTRRNFSAVEKVWSSWVQSAAEVRVSLAVRLRELAEPKTGLGLAALDGFFSA